MVIGECHTGPGKFSQVGHQFLGDLRRLKAVKHHHENAIFFGHAVSLAYSQSNSSLIAAQAASLSTLPGAATWIGP